VASAQITLMPFTPGSALFRDAVHVFTQTWNRDHFNAMNFMRKQATYANFHGITAHVDGKVAGMGFGTCSEPGQWWHDLVAAQVGADHPALQHAWVLTELAVIPAFRGQGIGGRIHDTLLAEHGFPRALLSTNHDNPVARRMYEERGWSYLHPGFAFTPGDRPFAVMRRELEPAEQLAPRAPASQDSGIVDGVNG